MLYKTHSLTQSNALNVAISNLFHICVLKLLVMRAALLLRCVRGTHVFKKTRKVEGKGKGKGKGKVKFTL